MKSVYLLPLTGLLLAAGCKKDPIKTLPKATQVGKNKMGCLVNGKAWTPSNPQVTPPGSNSNPWAVRWRLTPVGRALTLTFFSATGRAEVPTAIQLFVPDVRRPMTAELNQTADPSTPSANPAHGLCSLGNHTPDRDFLTGTNAVGELVITRFDTVARVVAGTFRFTGREAATGQTVEVTDGRFDMRLP